MKSVHVGNRRRALTEVAAFAPHGAVLGVSRLSDLKTGAVPAFAFVELATPEAARAAVALNGSTFSARRWS